MGEQVAARSHGGVAQLGEHLPCKQGVKSSNLSVSTTDSNSELVTTCTLKTSYRNELMKIFYS